MKNPSFGALHSCQSWQQVVKPIRDARKKTRRINPTTSIFAWLCKIFAQTCKIATCWISSSGFLPCISYWLGNLLPSLEKGYEVLQSSNSSLFELQLALPWISQNSPSFLACFNDQIATKNTKTCEKLISSPCQVP